MPPSDQNKNNTANDVPAAANAAVPHYLDGTPILGFSDPPNPAEPAKPRVLLAEPVIERPAPQPLKVKFIIPGILLAVLLVSAAALAAKQVIYTKKPSKTAGTSIKVAAKDTDGTKTAAAAAPTQQSTSSPVKSSQPVQAKPTVQTPAVVSSGPPMSGAQNTIPLVTSGGLNFYYAGGRQSAIASGASVRMTQAQPKVTQASHTENHSLMELAVETADGKQIVEVGWIVDQIMFGNASPHLFVFHWVNGQVGCYNGCGFVQVSASHFPGDAVATGTTGDYQINYSNSKWLIWYNGDNIGYFPASLWSGGFTQAAFIQVFGEVETSLSMTCVDMGNGISGNTAGSAAISNFNLIGSASPASLFPYATAPSTYSYGAATATGLNIGGPGAC
jgi:hypothetical protein